MRRSSAAGLEPGTEMALAMDPRDVRALTDDGTYRLEGADRSADEMVALLDRPARPLPDRLARRRSGARRLDGLGAARPARSGTASNSSATTSS